MAIVASDIKMRFSVAAAAGNTTAQGDPNASLGDQISTTDITDATLHNIFDVVTGDENAASEAEYRGIFVLNNHATLTWYAPKVWLSAEVGGGAVAAIGLDTTGKSDKAAAVAQALTVANENTAPAGVTFSAPTTKGTGLTLPDLAPGEVYAIWIRRTAANTVAVNNDGATIQIEGDTAA